MVISELKDIFTIVNFSCSFKRTPSEILKIYEYEVEKELLKIEDIELFIVANQHKISIFNIKNKPELIDILIKKKAIQINLRSFFEDYYRTVVYGYAGDGCDDEINEIN